MATSTPSLIAAWYSANGSNGWTQSTECYSGVYSGNNYRSCVQYNTGSFTGTSNYLRVSLKLHAKSSPAGLYAVLSTNGSLATGQVVADSYYSGYANGPHPSYLASGCTGYIAESDSYSDSACTTLQGGYDQGSGHTVYFKFSSSNIKPNTTYYIYFMRYIKSGDSTTSGWTEWYTSDMSATLDYMGSYTISYNANGGSGTMSSHTVTYNSSTSIKSNTFTRKGYTFAGWTTNSNGTDDGHNWTGWSGNWVFSDGQYGIANGELALYARWTPNTYTISYNANGGSGTMSSHTATYDSYIAIKNNGFSRRGYTFGGWTTKSNGTTDNYGWSTPTYTGWSGTWTYANGDYGVTNGQLLLYAIWVPNTYTVSYNANGGSGSMSSHTATYDATFTVKNSEFTRTGYNFIGWTTKSDGTDDGYNWTGASGTGWSGTWQFVSGEYGIVNGTVLLYARWALKTYTVSYNANGGSNAPSAQTKTHGVTLTLTSSKPTAPASTTSTGTITVTYNANGGTSTPSSGQGTYTDTTTKSFKNWNTAAAGTGTTYESGGSYTNNAAVTLYAQWNSSTSRTTNPTITTAAAISQNNGSTTGYTVTFNANCDSITAPASKTSTRTIKYTFAGWNTNASGTGTTHSASTSYTFSQNTTLYAKWTASYINNAITLPTVTRKGYTFKGWSTSSTASSGSTGSYTPSSNVILYAVWEANTYTVSYNANGGSGSMSSHTATYGETFTVKNNTFTRDGYTFAGWTTNSDGTDDGHNWTGWTGTGWSGTWEFVDGEYGIVNGTVLLYARWAINTYTISYNANGGTSSTVPENQTKTHGTTLTLSSTKPTRSNGTTTYTITYNANGGTCSTLSATSTKTTTYTFSTWNTASGGDGTSYAAGASYTANTAATLYAQWSSSSTTTSVKLPTPTRTGYTFLGWSTSSTATNGSTDSYTPASSITLYATWAKNQITVSINKDGSVWSTSNKSVSLIQNGTVVETKTASTSSVVFNSKTYSGIYTIRVQGLNNTIDYTTVTASYNAYRPVNFYTLTCSAGTGISSTSGSGIYLHGETAAISATVKTGYTWSTWSDNNTTRSRNVTVSGKQTLTASATANTYTVQYRTTYGAGTTSSSSHTYDTNKALTSNGFSRTGYTFLGWSTSSTATSATYTNGQSVKNLSSTDGATVTLYAVWQLSATWSPALVLAGTSTAATTHAFGTKFDLKFNTSPKGTFSSYSVEFKIGTTVVRIFIPSGTVEQIQGITIDESSLSEVSSMSSSYACSVSIAAIDASGADALTSTINFTQTVTAASKPTLSVTTELIDLTGICPGKELGRYTKLLIKPVASGLHGASITNITIVDPKSTEVVNSATVSNYTTAPLDLNEFTDYYDTSDPKLSWVVTVTDSRGQTKSETITQSVLNNIPLNIHAYVPYIWSGSAWVKYTPEIASSNSISSSDIYVPFIKD